MSNDKNETKERTGFTKAGHNSKSGGKRKGNGRGINSNRPDLFTQILQDKREQEKMRREEAKQQTIAKEYAFRVTKAELAKSLLNLPNGTTRDIAELIIDNFVCVVPNQAGEFIETGTGKIISRTLFAQLLIIDQMKSDQLKNRQLVENARFGARTVLSMAHKQLKSASAHQVAA